MMDGFSCRPHWYLWFWVYEVSWDGEPTDDEIWNVIVSFFTDYQEGKYLKYLERPEKREKFFEGEIVGIIPKELGIMLVHSFLKGKHLQIFSCEWAEKFMKRMNSK